MKAYVLHNDELGWTDRCPVFIDKSEAEKEAANKCRFYSVIEIDIESGLEPCTPLKKLHKCVCCPRFKGEKK